MFKQKIAIINEETGEVKAYDSVKSVIDNINRYIVEVDGKYGIIDEKGNELCELRSDVEISYNFQSGFFLVISNGKYGFVDANGKDICKPKYDMVENYTNGFARVNLNGKWGFIDTEGKEICNIEYENASDFDDMCAPVKKNGKWGIIDSNGNIICNFKYDEISHLTKGLWRVKNSDALYSLLNEKFEEITPFKYDSLGITFADSNIIKVAIGAKVGFINKKGEEIIPVVYDYAYNPVGNYPIIAEKGDKWGIISIEGHVLVDFKYDHISFFDQDGYTKLTNERKTRNMKDTYEHVEWADVNGKIYPIRPPKPV